MLIRSGKKWNRIKLSGNPLNFSQLHAALLRVRPASERFGLPSRWTGHPLFPQREDDRALFPPKGGKGGAPTGASIVMPPKPVVTTEKLAGIERCPLFLRTHTAPISSHKSTQLYSAYINVQWAYGQAINRRAVQSGRTLG